MKNKVDYVYEYSDLNLFQTRVKILGGKYAGVILEFGGSGLTVVGKDASFAFEYTLYEKPETLANIPLRGDPDFEKYLGKVLVSIVGDRRKDKDERAKLDQAASVQGASSNIKIDSFFYPHWINQHAVKKPIAQGLQRS